ncbi:MAG: nuclear transport factor 2 family protein [Pseudomonadota bacterium]|nr:nuclear transport factor 2 family protein [Pseudomonadota bacterium]MDQ3159882.1 nuclear transport factor 2 family protein [Pseudomonadota bacterium]
MHALNRIRATILLASLAWMVSGMAVAAEEAPSASDCFVVGFKAGNADAVAACYAEDAVMWFPGGPITTGRAAIRDGFAGYLSSVTVKDVVLNNIGQEGMGDVKVSWGTYAFRVVDNATGIESVTRGRFTDVSKKVDGRWLYIVDHPSDDPAPAAK